MMQVQAGLPTQFPNPAVPSDPTVLTNAELADAIRYAYDNSRNQRMAGYGDDGTKAGEVMLAHLKVLVAAQATRGQTPYVVRDQAESGAPIAAREKKAWNAGYYCAVALLLRETGVADTAVKSLFGQSGHPELADDDDQALFRKHGLMPYGEVGQ